MVLAWFALGRSIFWFGLVGWNKFTAWCLPCVVGNVQVESLMKCGYLYKLSYCERRLLQNTIHFSVPIFLFFSRSSYWCYHYFLNMFFPLYFFFIMRVLILFWLCLLKWAQAICFKWILSSAEQSLVIRGNQIWLYTLQEKASKELFHFWGKLFPLPPPYFFLPSFSFRILSICVWGERSPGDSASTITLQVHQILLLNFPVN